MLDPDHPRLYSPEKVNRGLRARRRRGDAEAALARRRSASTPTYTTPAEHNNPMEPHATIALLGAATS